METLRGQACGVVPNGTVVWFALGDERQTLGIKMLKLGGSLGKLAQVLLLELRAVGADLLSALSPTTVWVWFSRRWVPALSLGKSAC